MQLATKFVKVTLERPGPYGMELESINNGNGVRIKVVIPGGLADKAKVKVGDIVMSAHGRAVEIHFQEFLQLCKRGADFGPLKFPVKRIYRKRVYKKVEKDLICAYFPYCQRRVSECRGTRYEKCIFYKKVVVCIINCLNVVMVKWITKNLKE